MIQHQIKMIGYIKERHTSIFFGQTGCEKTHLVLGLIETEYNKYFHYIVFICPTLRENSIYHAKEWIRNDEKVWPVQPKGNLYQWIKNLSELLPFLEVLFINGDIIANENLDKKRQPLLQLSISKRHRVLYLWLLRQSYTTMLKNLGRQAKTIFLWYRKERGDLKMKYDENYVVMDVNHSLPGIF